MVSPPLTADRMLYVLKLKSLKSVVIFHQHVGELRPFLRQAWRLILHDCREMMLPFCCSGCRKKAQVSNSITCALRADAAVAAAGTISAPPAVTSVCRYRHDKCLGALGAARQGEYNTVRIHSVAPLRQERDASRLEQRTSPHKREVTEM